MAILSLALVGALLTLLPATGDQAARAQWPTWLNETPKRVTFPEILVDAGWLKGLLSKRGLEVVLVLDARSEERYRAGHIPGSINAISASTTVGIPPRYLDTATIFVIYTDDRQPLNAARVFTILEARQGARKPRIHVLNGGLDAWRRAGGEVTTVAPVPPTNTGASKLRLLDLSYASADTTVVTTIETLAKRYGRPGLTIIDPRPVAEWEKGHIPHSLPVNFEEFRNDDGTLMDGPTMRPILATFGPRPRDFINLNDAFVIAGLPPANATVHPYLALRVMGIPSVKLLPSSFEAWRDQGLPVTRIVHAEEMRRLVETAHPKRQADRPAPSLILLDLRHDPDFDYSHLPGAILLTPDRFDAALDSLVRAHWPGADRALIPFAVYCYGPDCIRSRIATTTAAHHGFRNLIWFRDGPQAYRMAGGKLFGKIEK